MDTVYVIYFDNQMYKQHGRKCVYLEKKNAKQVMTVEIQRVADSMMKENNVTWWNVTDEDKKKYIELAKPRFEISRKEVKN